MLSITAGWHMLGLYNL